MNANPKALSLLTEEFIDGYSLGPNTSVRRSQEDSKIMEDLSLRMQEHYNWNEKKPFSQTAIQNCSDMIVYVCKFS